MKSSGRSLVTVFAMIGSTCYLLAAPAHLRTNYRETPLGIDSEKPRFFWQSDSAERNWRQSAYRVLVSTNQMLLAQNNPDIWDSGKRSSDESVDIPYEGKPLQSGHRYFWTVEVWDRGGNPETATPTWFEMGLLRPEDWKAKWISGDEAEQESDHAAAKWIVAPNPATAEQSVTLFRKKISITKPAFQASISVIANGPFESFVNGRPISHKDGWQSFDFHEIHADLHPGDNTIEIRARQPHVDNRTQLRSACAVAALVKIVDEDGTIHRFGTDIDWTVGDDASQAATLAPQSSYLQDSGRTSHFATNLRKSFSVPNKIISARLYVTAMGSYRASLNGRQIGDDVLTPDFTDYRRRVNYQTYDVTPMLAHGANTLSLLLGAGWYGSGLTWSGAYSFGTAPPSILAKLVIETADGKTTNIVTNSSWQAAKAPILNSEIYAGETFDARIEESTPYAPAIERPAPPALLTAQEDLPVQRRSSITPIKLTTLPNGDAVFDMGQNMVGWTQLRAHGPRGATVHLQYAERLNSDGSVYTENLRSAEANDTFILSGRNTEVFEPSFTFHGFRYVQVSGYPGTPTLRALQGIVINSLPAEPSAKLQTSSELVNKMWTAGLWGQRGNFVSIPTDCPQRDERLGWMGDAGVFWRTGAYNFDIDSFSHKFLRDVDDAQTPAGAFTNVAPDVLKGNESVGAPGWGDAGVIVPYTTWLQYGDRAAIDDNWTQMERWMVFIEQANPDHLRRNKVGPNFGDWLAPDSNTPKDLAGTAYWALIAKMMQAMAASTGRTVEADRYAQLQNSIRDAFQKAYIQEDGEVKGSTQTAYLLTLYLHLAPANLERSIADRLVADITAHGTHLTTGFLGTPFLLSVLDEQGRLDVAYKLLLNDTYPSWGYMIAKGSTTWWERWNGDTGDPSMNSYNHYAFGSVMAWVYRRVAGIDTAEDGPGFHHIVIAPQLNPLMTSTAAEYQSAYGTIKTAWRTADGRLSLDVTVPPNTSATVIVPVTAGQQVYEDGKLLPESAIRPAPLQVGSGTYHFETRKK